MNEIFRDCHDCGAQPGQMHMRGCDTEHCSVCGGQRIQCSCKGHDPAFARWTGFWPGRAEAELLGVTLNELRGDIAAALYMKPTKTSVGRAAKDLNIYLPQLRKEADNYKDRTKYL